MKQPGSRNQQISGMPKPLLGVKMEDVQGVGHWTSKGEERGEEKRGVGLSKEGVGLLVEVPRDLKRGSFK